MNRFTAFLFLLLALSISSVAQLTATVSANVSRVQALAWDGSHQSASWTFTVTPGGSYGTLNFVTWSVDGITIVTNSGTHALDTFTWVAVDAAAKHTISAYMSYSVGVTGSLTVAAIGGPFIPTVNEGDGVDLVPSRDSGVDQPCYLQYFGYTYTTSGAKPDSDLETPQTGSASPQFTQPTGTTYSWSPTGGIAIVGSSTSSAVNVSASSSSTTGAAKLTLTYSYTDPSDSSLTGTATDDSQSSPKPFSTTVNANWHNFTCHEPDNAEEVSATTSYSSSNPQATYVSHLKLTDNLSADMPGVWVQERFPNGATEVTRHDPKAGVGEIGANSDSIWWTTGTGGEFGLYGGSPPTWAETPDTITLSLPWNNPAITTWPHGSHSTDPWVIYTQEYYAGTKSTTTQGILVATFTITEWTDQITHS